MRPTARGGRGPLGAGNHPWYYLTFELNLCMSIGDGRGGGSRFSSLKCPPAAYGCRLSDTIRLK